MAKKQARVNDSEVIVISSDSESGRKPRVKKEDIRVKLEGSQTTKAKGKVRNRQAIPVPLPGLKACRISSWVVRPRITNSLDRFGNYIICNRRRPSGHGRALGEAN